MERSIITKLDDKRIDELLMYTPGYTDENSNKIKNLFMQKTMKKRNPGKRIVLVAAVVAVFVTISGLALAVFTNYDLGRFFNSLFHNPAADEYKIESGQTINTGGLEITLLSAFSDNYNVYMMLEIKDTEAGRLSESMVAYAENVENLFTNAVVYNEETNSVTMILNLFHYTDVNIGDSIEIYIDTILSNVLFVENQEVGFDISAHATNTETSTPEEWTSAVGEEGVGSDSWAWDDSTASGDKPVPLAIGNMDVPINGVDWAVVTNSGFLNGMLHIQVKHTDEYNAFFNRGFFSLIDKSGNTIHNSHSISAGRYEELLFDIGEDATLTDYKLAISGVFYEYVIHGPWELSFTVTSELPLRSMTAFPIDSPYFAKIEVEVTPMKTVLVINPHGSSELDENEVTYHNIQIDLNEMVNYVFGSDWTYLTLHDGSIVVLNPFDTIFDIDIGWASYQSEFFDIDELYSITFCGEEFVFN